MPVKLERTIIIAADIWANIALTRLEIPVESVINRQVECRVPNGCLIQGLLVNQHLDDASGLDGGASVEAAYPASVFPECSIASLKSLEYPLIDSPLVIATI